ncbi:acetolactate synthase small subunit [Corynebacterium genitalium ATCC 33030]|uniref:Acetolactate synthase small subunit n=1 Tax=Corynebacterium genitalium ATCC 33030 TaxID=585529 RepID=D7WD91_9CORY|nr:MULTISPECIES: acetolactate synthase small subunit [Corynebacterium]MCQ4618183.1 acetolactate synthase small subunit [Corynebacterium pseudogenitalium]EFK54122.1 acetolactate synthase, small subunit [Corynebacterium genitalium ATCC 33030]MCQ4620221.1 acetolactate synthase small subunit [Corynebacterium sp. CCUG 71335]MCQ4621980.1 acetolactate synthase small subunit [Corynebacterium sp. CCUG 70398]MCQ4625055.1 acetolactate synthase small subunit [Corynebacterium sp. CCUG 69979]
MTTNDLYDDVTRSVLSVLVQDVDGIITRVTAMFTRRGFNLVSLATAKTETEGINRITVVVDASEHAVEQITKQLHKLIHVIKVIRLEEDKFIARSLMLVKVNANNSNRPQVVDAANIFRARVVDVSPDSVVIEATGTSSKLKALLEVLEPFGIRELVQSGRVALNRGAKTLAPSK